MEEIVELLVQRLADDESWQGDLRDEERKAALLWASTFFRGRVNELVAEARSKLRALDMVIAEDNGVDGIERGAIVKAWLA